MRTVCRRQYRHNRSICSNLHQSLIECWLLIDSTNQHSNKHKLQLTINVTTVCLTGKGWRGEGSKEGETFNVAGVGTHSKQVVFSNKQRKRCETSRKFNAGRILQKSIRWLHKIIFLVEMCRTHWNWCQKWISMFNHVLFYGLFSCTDKNT
jgi:hypothetical protein